MPGLQDDEGSPQKKWDLAGGGGGPSPLSFNGSL